MNGFLTPLQVEKVGYDAEGRPIWRLLGDLVYRSDRFGMLGVPAGFQTNFASVPRLPVVFLVAGDRAHEQATLHDWQYTVHSMSRPEADELFLEALQAQTVIPPQLDKAVPGWMAKAMYWAVRLAGQGSWDAPTFVPQPWHVQDVIAAREAAYGP